MPSTNGYDPKRAILYARAATRYEAESKPSISRQLETLREYACKEDYEVVEEVKDPGESGSFLDRPGMQRIRWLVAGEEEGGVSAVLATDEDRFSRRVVDRLLLERELGVCGCELRTLWEGSPRA
jgi:site-specific DNA recombinase